MVWTYVAYEPSGEGCGVWGTRTDTPDSLQDITDGSRRAQLDERLDVAPGDLVLRKRMASAFFETSLASLLVWHRVDTVIVTGGSTSGCVRAMAVDSLSRGYRAIVPEECVADKHESPHFGNLYDLSVKYADVLPVADVVAIEANPYFRGGCTTVLSSGLVPGAGTSQQDQHGTEDRPEYLAEDVLHRAGGDAPTDVVHALATASAPLVGWLSDVLGQQLKLAVDAHYPGQRVPRLHGLPERSGAVLHRAMLAAVQRRAHTDLAFPFRLTGLEEDGADWRVVVEDPGGTTTLSARAVVLANAGFAHAPGLLAEHLPALAGIAYHGGDGNDGGALRIGASLGLETAYLDSLTAHASFAPEHGVLVTWNVMMQGGVIVDRSDSRFADKSSGHSGFA